jgi:hypothetical protein
MVWFASHGLACDFVPIEEAGIVDGWLAWRGRRYQGAVRYFMVTPKVADQLDFIIALGARRGHHAVWGLRCPAVHQQGPARRSVPG